MLGNSTYQVSFANIFSNSVSCHFILLTVCFKKKIYIKSSLSLFPELFSPKSNHMLLWNPTSLITCLAYARVH